MAKPILRTPARSNARKAPPQSTQRPPRDIAKATREIVDPRWLLKMFSIALAAALVCGYLTAAWLFYFSSWQLVLHPTRNTGGGTALPTQHVQFDVDAAGKPLLSGEWYPAEPGASRTHYIVLYLRSGDGQLDPADGTQIATLHGLGLNVFAFDYAGYGSSSLRPHLSEYQMLADATSAHAYAARTYNFREPGQFILFGSGLGVSIGAQMLASNAFPQSDAALIGYNADPEVLTRVKADRRSKLFPIILFHDRFSLDALETLKTPKLLYTVGPDTRARAEIYRTAADPKLTVEVPTHNGSEERAALVRFLDQNFPRSIPALQLNPKR